MTLATLMHELGHDGAPYGFQSSTENSEDLWPTAVQFYG